MRWLPAVNLRDLIQIMTSMSSCFSWVECFRTPGATHFR
jgi:hypothetical protein